MSEAKEFYRRQAPENTPLFQQPWWLDSVCGEQWDAVIHRDHNQLKAAYLYAVNKTGWGQQIVMPPLTQFLGPLYQLTASGTRERNNEETDLLEKLLTGLPPFSGFESRWQHAYQNWLPFHWQQFHQRTRYTYVLEDLSDPEKLRAGFSEKVRREISKAEKLFHAETADGADDFYRLLSKNFREKKIHVPFSLSWFQKVYGACRANQSGKILLAKDEGGKIAAGIFVAGDARTVYYLIGGKNDDYGNSGAMSFLFWRVFSELRSAGKKFDFEGSMLKGVENYFRSFGAVQKGFFEITKVSSSLLKVKKNVRSMLGR